MNKLFHGLEYVRTYFDVVLIISNKSFEDQVKKLDKVLSKSNQKGFKEITEKSYFARNELEYLGFRITQKEIMSLPDRVKTIKNIAVPPTKKQLRSFFGLINYYRDMRQYR